MGIQPIDLPTMIYENFLTIADAAAQQQGGGSSFIIPMVAMVAIFYFLIIRPQNQKQKQLQSMMSSLKTGDKVVTAGGIHGLISNVKDKTVIVKIADNVKVEVDKASITSVTKEAKEPAPADA
jgi:preprotein translocase subunit YajC